MHIETLLDYETITANRPSPVHVVLRFTAPKTKPNRTGPIAFSLVLDRSSSMSGSPLLWAKEAARTAIHNLRHDDQISLIVFDHSAQVVIPMQPAADKQKLLEAVDTINVRGPTNLVGGWMLARDELKKAPANLPRRALLLTDGAVNAGITDPAAITHIAATGLERDQITTSCLGFGDDYNEDLLAAIAAATNASFYDANSADQFPAIFTAELDGLQALAVQNLRVRLVPLDFCKNLAPLVDYPTTILPNGIFEIMIGNLISDETRTMITAMDILAIPLLSDGQPAADLDGERLIGVEILYDLLQPDQVTSHEWKQIVRIHPVQEEKDLCTNFEVIGILSTQQTGKTLKEAIAETDEGRVKEARERLQSTIQQLRSYPPSAETLEGIRILSDFLERLQESGHWNARDRKSARYHATTLSKMSSTEEWLASGPPPTFNKSPATPTISRIPPKNKPHPSATRPQPKPQVTSDLIERLNSCDENPGRPIVFP